jgi:hypothetical protein
MSQVTYRCDGCNIEAPGVYYNGDFHKPHLWFIRSDDDGAQIACSRKCIDKISELSGKTKVVLPF